MTPALWAVIVIVSFPFVIGCLTIGAILAQLVDRSLRRMNARRAEAHWREFNAALMAGRETR